VSVLTVHNVGKAFRRYSSEWKRFARWFGLPSKPVSEHWVLRNINFSIQPGEAVGIIGQNGAGKSTLLKMITGTLQPSEGRVEVNGRIAAILELGMGFSPELTGRQNVIHAAGLMGFDLQQIQQAIPSIEAFAEIGSYFDEPVRTYSSGMQVRLAFAVATAYRPEILIVDEALSVGDTYFQHKSFSRIREFQQQGTTLLIVSHDRSAIQSLCSRAILIEKGSVVQDGEPEQVFDYYNALVAEKENSTVTVKQHKSGKAQTSSGTGEAKIESITLYNSKGELAELVAVGEQVELRITAVVLQPITSLVLGYAIKDRLGQLVYGTNTWHTEQVIEQPCEGSVYSFNISFPANFGEGGYSVVVALHDRETHMSANYDWRDLALVFNVVNLDKTKFEGGCWNQPSIEVKSLDAIN